MLRNLIGLSSFESIIDVTYCKLRSFDAQKTGGPRAAKPQTLRAVTKTITITPASNGCAVTVAKQSYKD